MRTKFDEPRYKIQFASSEDARQFASQSELVSKAEQNIVYVEIREEKPTMQQLLQRLASAPHHVIKVERETASLEEIFMKVVGTNDPI